MRSLIALPALVAVAAAQAETFDFGRTVTETRLPATSADNVEPSATETGSGPINTGRACAQIASLVGRSSLEYPSVEAEVRSPLFLCLFKDMV